jgi:hypothetical protein
MAHRIPTVQTFRGSQVHITIQAISALAELHGNHSPHAEEAAIRAATEGRAAFWHMAHPTNSFACRFARLCCAMPIAQAMPEAESFTDREGWAASREYLLTILIPLNPAARQALLAARGLA